MRHRRQVIAYLALIFMFSGLLGFSQQKEKSEERSVRALTLNDCLTLALAGNPDLLIDAMTPEMDSASVSAAKEKFLPQFNLNSAYHNEDYPSTWGVQGPTISSKYDYYGFGLSALVVTGTKIQLSLNTSRTDSSMAFTIINPSYYSEFRLDVTQPLLRDFGPKVNNYEAIKASRQLDASTAALKMTLLDTIYNVEEAYWNLYYAREYVRVLQLSLDQSREILKMNQEAARIGARSSIEVVNSETDVAGYEDQVLSARLQADIMENRLKSLLGMPTGAGEPGKSTASEEAAVSIVPSDKPQAEKRSLAYEETLRIALTERPELAQYESQALGAAADISYYRNQALPRLDLQFSLWYPGQSGVRFIFQDENPLTGLIIGKIVGNRADSFKDIFKGTYRNLSLFLTLSVPLGDIISRASLARAKLAQAQANLQVDKQRRAIELDVSEALKAVELNARKIETSARYREFMEKRVAAETERYNLGLVGSDWLFSYQRNLATAKADEIKSIIDYKISLAKLDRAMGMSLKSKVLKFKEHEF